jgi:hypothetical protein
VVTPTLDQHDAGAVGMPKRQLFHGGSDSSPRTGSTATGLTNGPTESLNNLIKRIALGFRDFENQQIRALL